MSLRILFSVFESISHRCFCDICLKGICSSIEPGYLITNLIYFAVNDKEILVDKDANGINQSKGNKNRDHVSGDKKSANRILADNVRQQMILEARRDEWRKAALVLNHICIWVFLFAVVVSFMAIFFQAPL